MFARAEKSLGGRETPALAAHGYKGSQNSDSGTESPSRPRQRLKKFRRGLGRPFSKGPPAGARGRRPRQGNKALKPKRTNIPHQHKIGKSRKPVPKGSKRRIISIYQEHTDLPILFSRESASDSSETPPSRRRCDKKRREDYIFLRWAVEIAGAILGALPKVASLFWQNKIGISRF